MATKKISPKAAPAAPVAKAAPAKAAPAAKAAPKADTYALHLNKTGRLCIGSDAAERLNTGLGQTKNTRYALLKIEGKIIRLIPQKKSSDGTLPVRDGGGRPYVSATKAFKSLGFDGSDSLDFEAKAYGAAGLEWRWQ